MTSLATTWWPSLDPIGPASVTAFVAGGVFWMLAEVPTLARFQRQIVGVASILFIAFLYLSAAPVVMLAAFDVWGLKYKRFPGYSDFIGNYVVMAVGLILAIKVCGRARHVAIGFGIVFACLIAGEVFGFVFQFLGG